MWKQINWVHRLPHTQLSPHLPQSGFPFPTSPGDIDRPQLCSMYNAHPTHTRCPSRPLWFDHWYQLHSRLEIREGHSAGLQPLFPFVFLTFLPSKGFSYSLGFNFLIVTPGPRPWGLTPPPSFTLSQPWPSQFWPALARWGCWTARCQEDAMPTHNVSFLLNTAHLFPDVFLNTSRLFLACSSLFRRNGPEKVSWLNLPFYRGGWTCPKSQAPPLHLYPHSDPQFCTLPSNLYGLEAEDGDLGFSGFL